MTQKINIIAGMYDAFAYESITVANSAIGFTTATHKPTAATQAYRAILTIETAQIRYRYDGTNPSSTEGHILNANDVLTIVGPANIAAFKAIRTGATSGVIKVSYER